jgi:hypothetical protein
MAPGRLPELRGLSFSHSKAITPNGMGAPLGLKKLRRLHIGYASVDDNCLKCIGKHTTLEHLQLQGVPISDRGLSALAPLTSLRYLYISDCSR